MYTILFKAPCRLPNANGITYYYTGDVLQVEDADYEFIETNYQNYFIMMGYTEDKKQKKQSKSEVKPQLQIDKNLLTPEVEIPVKHTANVPLSEDANWQEVKNYVLKLEEEIPVNLQAIAEVKVKFGNYPSVVKECERILTNNNVTVK